MMVSPVWALGHTMIAITNGYRHFGASIFDTRSDRVHALLISACIVLHANGLAAQGVDTTWVVQRSACLDTVSSASIPSIVFVRATVKDSSDASFARMADLFAQSVSQRLRSLLRAKGDAVPHGEPAITWRSRIDSRGALSVTIPRSGDPVLKLLSAHVDTVAAAMLLSTARNVVDDGEGPIWPNGALGDSLTFSLAFVTSDPGQVRLFSPGRVAFPVFSVFYPQEIHAVNITRSAPEYPPMERGSGFTAFTAVVITQFEVDTLGRVVPGTVSDIWSPAKKRPTGRLLVAYNDFLDAVKRWLPSAKFAPALIGGCRVRGLVVQPFTFDIRH
jgi:hypothetical protein